MAYLHDECYYDELDTMVQTTFSANKGGKCSPLFDTRMPPDLSSLAGQKGRVEAWEYKEEREYNPGQRKEPRVWDTTVTPPVAKDVGRWTQMRAYPYLSTLAPTKASSGTKKAALAKNKAAPAIKKATPAKKKTASAKKKTAPAKKKAALAKKKAAPAKKKAAPAKKNGPKTTIKKRPIKKRPSRAQS